MTETSQRQLGESDSPIEDELEEAFTRMVDEGSQRLHRTWREVVVTGFTSAITYTINQTNHKAGTIGFGGGLIDITVTNGDATIMAR